MAGRHPLFPVIGDGPLGKVTHFRILFRILAHKEDIGYDIGSFTGIGFRYPVLGGLLTLFLVSLAGIAPRSVLAFAERSILSLLM